MAGQSTPRQEVFCASAHQMCSGEPAIQTGVTNTLKTAETVNEVSLQKNVNATLSSSLSIFFFAQFFFLCWHNNHWSITLGEGGRGGKDFHTSPCGRELMIQSILAQQEANVKKKKTSREPQSNSSQTTIENSILVMGTKVEEHWRDIMPSVFKTLKTFSAFSDSPNKWITLQRDK